MFSCLMLLSTVTDVSFHLVKLAITNGWLVVVWKEETPKQFSVYGEYRCIVLGLKT